MKKKRIGCLPVLMIFSLIVIIAIGFIYYKDGKTYSDLETEVTYQKKEKKKSKGDDGYRVNWKKLKNKDVVGWIRFKHPMQNLSPQPYRLEALLPFLFGLQSEFLPLALLFHLLISAAKISIMSTWSFYHCHIFRSWRLCHTF